MKQVLQLNKLAFKNPRDFNDEWKFIRVKIDWLGMMEATVTMVRDQNYCE